MTGLLLLAAALPALVWEGAPDTAKAKEAGVEHVLAPASQVGAWKQAGFDAHVWDAKDREKLPAPGVEYRPDVATATRAPWLTANGWRILREPSKRFFYDAQGRSAALAAVEAFTYGADAAIHTDTEGLAALGPMMKLLRSLESGPHAPMVPMANIGIVDDGSSAMGEVMNLLARRNLLFRIVTAPDAKLDVNAQLGSKAYPKEDAKDPAVFAQKIRQRLSDEKRLLRIYGTEVVIGRLLGDGAHAHLCLINYSRRKVDGVRVRVLGAYRSAVARPTRQLLDQSADGKAIEFTLPELDIFSIIDLTR